MKTTLTPISTDDRKDIIDIFNFYVENSFTAYPEKKLPGRIPVEPNQPSNNKRNKS